MVYLFYIFAGYALIAGSLFFRPPARTKIPPFETTTPRGSSWSVWLLATEGALEIFMGAAGGTVEMLRELATEERRGAAGL